MPEQTLDGQMDVCTAHRRTSRRQDLDDRSLHHAIAQPTCLWRWRRMLNRLQWLIRQGLEHCLQRGGGVCKVF